MSRNKEILQKLEQLSYSIDEGTTATPEEIYESLTGKRPVVYSKPISAIYGSNFYNLDKLLKESVEGANRKEDIREEVSRLIAEYERYERLTQRSLLSQLPDNDRERIMNSIDRIYGDDFFENFGDGYLSDYDRLDGEWIEVIDRKGDLYSIKLDHSDISPRIKGLKLEPCHNPPKDLQEYFHIYNSKYGVFVFERGASNYIAIPEILVSLQEIEIGDEPEIDDEFDLGIDQRDFIIGDFIIVPHHYPHFLMYDPKKKELVWESGSATYKMHLSLPN